MWRAPSEPMASARTGGAGLALPIDKGLPGLGLLLDVTAVRDRLRRADHDIEGGSLFYLKYKPGTSCIAAYAFLRPGSGERAVYYGKSMGPQQFPLAHDKASRHRWTEPTVGPAVHPWPEARALLFAFPNDARLDGLRILAKPRKIRRLVSGPLPGLGSGEVKTALVRYKPERRAVLRSAIGRAPFYWRVYADGQGPDVFRRLTVLAAAGVKAPRPYAYDPDRQILAMEELPGRPFEELLETEPAVPAAAAAALALARLHAAPGPGLAPRSAEDFLAAAVATRRMLARLSPEAGEHAARIVRTLRRTAPVPTEATAFVHGDLHPAQLLVGSAGVALLDFDRSHLGSPCWDLGGFLAHLRLARLEGRLHREDALARAFLDAYAARCGRSAIEPVAWWTALALLLLAPTPFRRLEADWPVRVRAILASAEERLC